MLLRLGIALAVAAAVLAASWAWRRRQGRFTQAGGSFDRSELGLTRRDRASAVIVEFGGEHCGSCRTVERRLANLSSELPDVRIVTLDIEDVPELAKRYDVRRVPTLFVTGPDLRIVWRASGVPTEEAVRTVLLGPDWAGRPRPKRRRHLLARRAISRERVLTRR